MALLTNAAILLVLACVSQQLMPSSGQKSHGRPGRGSAARGQLKVKVKPGLPAGRRPGAAPARALRGKTVAGDESECSWSATGDDVVVLAVACGTGGGSFGCEYVARPAACSQYAPNARLYWKQIGRALRRHGSLCRDGGAPVRAAVCRRAAAGDQAHFRLSRKTFPPPAPRPAAGAVRSCQPGNRKLAEEHCSDAWSSFCTFFFTMLQDYDC